MIVSHELETIFIKTRKVAGTSVQLALATQCGPDDIITPSLEPAGKDIGARAPQHYQYTGRQLTPWQLLRWLKNRSRPGYKSHHPASDIRRRLGDDVWNAYFTFTVERNPWDKAVSRYFWEKARKPTVPEFSHFLRSCPRHLLTCFDLYSDGGEVIVDQVLPFESLRDEIETVWRRLGVSPPPLPRTNASQRPASARDYRTMYTDDDAAFIAEVCAREIATFGYVFEARQPQRP